MDYSSSLYHQNTSHRFSNYGARIYVPNNDTCYLKYCSQLGSLVYLCPEFLLGIKWNISFIFHSVKLYQIFTINMTPVNALHLYLEVLVLWQGGNNTLWSTWYCGSQDSLVSTVTTLRFRGMRHCGLFPGKNKSSVLPSTKIRPAAHPASCTMSVRCRMLTYILASIQWWSYV